MPDSPIDWPVWLGTVAASMLAGVALLWIVGGYYHLRYYRFDKRAPEAWKCQPARVLRPGQERQAMLLSSANLALGGLVSGHLVYCLTHGWRTPIYFEVMDYGWTYTLASGLFFFVIADGMAYYAHRALHSRFLFRHIHRWHHRYIATTPFVVTAMHPLELLFFQAATFLPLLFLPVHYVAVIVVLIYALLFNIIDHSGVRLRSRLPWQAPTMFHDDHHAHFHCNFGQHLMLWDRLHGTLRRVGRRYGVDVFGGKGAAEGDGAPHGFVRY
jgi:lathosterol oxidase